MDEKYLTNVGSLFKSLVTDEDGDPKDVSTATTKQIVFRKSNGDNLTVTASFTTDGTDGYVQYSSASGDLDTLGIWEFQPYIEVGTEKFYGDISKFRVLRLTTP